MERILGGFTLQLNGFPFAMAARLLLVSEGNKRIRARGVVVGPFVLGMLRKETEDGL